MKVSTFIEKNYFHFNSLQLKLAARSYSNFCKNGGKMMLAMAGAMSTAEIGISLAEMIRKNKVHAITCTAANLEEDFFNLIGKSKYKLIPNYRELTPNDEEELLKQGLNRVTDVCIPEDAFRELEKKIIILWKEADSRGIRKFPHEFLYELLLSRELEKKYCIPKKNSWLLAAAEKKLPLFVPGWEDSTLGNVFAAKCIDKTINNSLTIKTGIEYMIKLVEWYKENSKNYDLGFFQIGGGIAGDFPICVVPLINQDLKEKVPEWKYFCQISDSTTSYGSYSGAPPNEKITWGKLTKHTQRFIIESDATIVAPLIFAYVLGW